MDTTEHHDPTTDLIHAVRRRATPLGYAVAATPDGFTVERDLADARWWGVMHRAGVRTLTGHEVRVDAVARTVTICDVQRQVEWRAGAVPGEARPSWRLDAEVTRGRVSALGTTRTWGVRDDGTVGTVEDYTFDTDAGRATVRDALAELGWREAMPLDQRIALWIAVGTLVGLVLCFGTWGLVALLG